MLLCVSVSMSECACVSRASTLSLSLPHMSVLTLTYLWYGQCHQFGQFFISGLPVVCGIVQSLSSTHRHHHVVDMHRQSTGGSKGVSTGERV